MQLAAPIATRFAVAKPPPSRNEAKEDKSDRSDRPVRDEDYARVLDEAMRAAPLRLH